MFDTFWNDDNIMIVLRPWIYEKIPMKQIIKIFILTIEIIFFVLLLSYHYQEPLTKYAKNQVIQMKMEMIIMRYNLKPEGLES